MKNNFESAVRFALDAHAGQLDSGFTPYIQHLMGVWSKVRNASMTTQIAALLHDTVEDTDVTLNQIEDNFGTDVKDVIAILTHNKTTPYAAYIEAIALSGNRAAMLVKLADLQDNMSADRLQRLPESSVAYFTKRAQTKYAPARARLLDALGNVIGARV